MSTPIFTEREVISNRLNRVAYHLEDGLGPNGLLYPYSAEQADIMRGLLDDLHAVSDWLEAQPAAPEVMTIPKDVRNWIASAAQVASDSARYYDVDPSTSDAVLAWLDAQPDAAPERWEPVTENSIACACGDRECSTRLEFWEGNIIALCYMGKSGYDGGEVHRVTSDIVLPADVRLCRRVDGVTL